MYIIMGGTGHVGSATAEALLARGEDVTILTRNAERAGRWQDFGAKVLEADIEDIESLRAAFRRGQRALILNLPAEVHTDTATVERTRVARILSALDGSGLEKVVAISTGGAQPGERLGDLNVLWELEEGLRRQAIPAAIHRGAYYMSNWDGMLEPVRATGKLPSMFDPKLAIPMVAPRDLGEIAAERLLSPLADAEVRYIEGPRRYTPDDVAQAFAKALRREVTVAVTPRAEWRSAFRRLGFSEAAADSYARMTEVSVDSGFDMPEGALRGTTSLDAYIQDVVDVARGVPSTAGATARARP